MCCNGISVCLPVEGDAGGSSPDGFQDLSKKQQRRHPQEDDRRRKEHGAPVS